MKASTSFYTFFVVVIFKFIFPNNKVKSKKILFIYFLYFITRRLLKWTAPPNKVLPEAIAPVGPS